MIFMIFTCLFLSKTQYFMLLKFAMFLSAIKLCRQTSHSVTQELSVTETGSVDEHGFYIRN